MELKGKKALIVGASRGIGEAIALAYAKNGADLVLAGRRLETLEKVADKVRKIGRQVHCLEWDIRDIDKAPVIMQQAYGAMNGLDIVVNNAGVVDKEGFLQITEENWDAIFDTNVKGVYFSCQSAAKFFITHKQKGRILNIASETGTQPSHLPYGVSKWGVLAFSMGMAKHLYKENVLLSTIAPGPIATDMMGWSKGKSMDFPNCFGSLGSPEEVADLAVFLVSDKNKRIIGRPVFVSGGLDW